MKITRKNKNVIKEQCWILYKYRKFVGAAEKRKKNW